MKKTLVVSTIALSIGSTNAVANHSITITEMKLFDTSYVASGTLSSNGGGQMYSIDPFFGASWVADQQNWFDGDGDAFETIYTWSGTGTASNSANAYDDFSYTFQLDSNQVAVGTFFDWNSNNNIPVLTIFDCGLIAPSTCTGNSLPMATAPFLGAPTEFNGYTTCNFPIHNRNADSHPTPPHECEASVVPIPAAVWLFGSGLLGLVGMARRKA